LIAKTNGAPRIESVKPAAALPGGELSIRGTGFASRNHTRPQVQFGAAEGNVVMAADDLLIARVPEGAVGGAVRVRMGSVESPPFPIALGVQIADNLHPVGNPAVDPEGNVYVTFSGQRGQKVPVSLYKVTSNHSVKPFITELINPTGLTLDKNGYLFVTCRNDGTVHRVSPDGRSMQWIEGMGIATGIAFDKGGSLYVGDRSGTIFKISPEREIFVFATLEPSIAAYHLAFSPAGELFVTGPTTSSYDRVFPRTGAPAGIGLRPSGQSLCGGLARRQARHRSPHPGSGSRSRARREQHRGVCALAHTSRHHCHQQRSLHSRLGRRRASPERLIGRHAGRNHRSRFGTAHSLSA
jgi:streptogramin lyase